MNFNKEDYIKFQWSDRFDLMGKVIKSEFTLITINRMIKIGENDIIIEGYFAEDLLSKFTFLNDKPCGKLKQQK